MRNSYIRPHNPPLRIFVAVHLEHREVWNIRQPLGDSARKTIVVETKVFQIGKICKKGRKGTTDAATVNHQSCEI